MWVVMVVGMVGCGLVWMVALVVSSSGVVFAREREEDTKKTTTTTTNGRRNYLKTQSAFANARGF